MRWLKKEARGSEVLFWIVAVVTVHVLYAIAGMLILEASGVDIPSAGSNSLTDLPSLFQNAHKMLGEEIVYRLPLAILVWATWPLAGLLAYAGFASFMFGVAHGSLWHVLFQGVSGFLLSLLFLKCGGLQGRWVKALACTFSAHFLYNAVTVVLATM